MHACVHVQYLYPGYDRSKVIGPWVFEAGMRQKCISSILRSPAVQKAMGEYQLLHPGE